MALLLLLAMDLPPDNSRGFGRGIGVAFAIGTNAVFLDDETHTMIAVGNPRWLREHADNPKVRQFLARGSGMASQAGAAR